MFPKMVQPVSSEGMPPWERSNKYPMHLQSLRMILCTATSIATRVVAAGIVAY